MDNKKNLTQGEHLDFLSEILVEGQELEWTFRSYKRNIYVVTGTIRIKEQDIVEKPRRGAILSPKAEAWMCTHPQYWKILCGLKPADPRTNIKIMGMLARAGLHELAEMMSRRIDVMISPASGEVLKKMMQDMSSRRE